MGPCCTVIDLERDNFLAICRLHMADVTAEQDIELPNILCALTRVLSI